MSEAKCWIDDLPLRSAIRYAFGSLFGCWRICFTSYAPWNKYAKERDGVSYFKAPWWLWLFQGFFVGPSFGMEQAYGCYFSIRKGWPIWPLDTAHRLHMFFSDWSEPKATWYTWLPADSGRPNEIGIHVPHSQITYGERDPETFERPILKRPRCFVYPPAVMTKPGTYSSGSTTVYEAAL